MSDDQPGLDVTQKLQVRKEMELGAQAKAFVENPAAKAAFDALERELITKMSKLNSTDLAGIQVAKIAIDLLGVVRGRLNKMIETGDLATESYRMEQEAKARPGYQNRWRKYFEKEQVDG